MAGNENSGRKTLLTEELIKELCKAKESGLSNLACCDYVGIDEMTLYQFLRKGEAKELEGFTPENSIYVKFMKEFKKSISKFKAYHINLIQQASKKGSWQGSAWLLERAYPKEFGRNIIVKDETSNGVLDKLATALEGLCNDEENKK